MSVVIINRGDRDYLRGQGIENQCTRRRQGNGCRSAKPAIAPPQPPRETIQVKALSLAPASSLATSFQSTAATRAIARGRNR
jgi:hypothetical protein